jgi:cyclophilin family peptidyl-prolyl cis-trans isomerase
VDNAFLDFKAKTQQGWGYCVFGRVTKGLDVVDAIEAEATTTKAGHQDVPVQIITIENAEVLP